MLYRSLYGVIIFVGLVCSLSEPWDGSVTLNDNVTLLWDRHRRSVSFRVESTANSWVGIGFNPGPGDGPMTNADMVILSKVGAELQLLDYWSSGFVAPDKDDTNNLQNTTFGITGDLLWFEFTRDWNTKDNMDNPIRNGENTILWAYGSSSDYGLSYHAARGHVEVDLSQDGVQEISEEEGHHHHHNTNAEEFFTFKYLHQESAGDDHHHSHDEEGDDHHHSHDKDDDNHSHHDKIDNHHSHDEDDDNHSHHDDSHFESRSLKNDEARRVRSPPNLDNDEDNHRTSRRKDENNEHRTSRSSRSNKDNEHRTSRSSRKYESEDNEHRTSRSSRKYEDNENRTSRSRLSRSVEYEDNPSSKSRRDNNEKDNQTRRSGYSRSIDYEKSENRHRSRDNKK